VVPGQARDRGREALLGLVEAATAQGEDAEGRVRAGVARVAAQRLAVVGLRVEVRVVELLEAQAREVQLLHVFTWAGGGGGAYRFGSAAFGRGGS
jgi:hypothetical protein